MDYKNKILLFTGSFPPPFAGGSVEYLHNLIKCFPKDTVVINTSHLSKDDCKKFDDEFSQKLIRKRFIIHVLEGARVNVLKKIVCNLLWPLYSIWIILKLRPKIIYVGEYNISLLGVWLVKRFFKIPLVLFTYAEEITQLINTSWHSKLLRYTIRKSDAIITVSDYTKSLLIDLGGKQETIFKILPSVSSNKLVVGRDVVEMLKLKYDLEGKEIILTVGRLEERKGHVAVLNTMPELITCNKNLVYVIVGTGNYENEIRACITKNGIEDHVIMTGRIDNADLAALYSMAKLFIMPHRELDNGDTEGCPTVFLEASSHGLPVIGGKSGGVRDAILDQKTGYIIDGKNKLEIRTKLYQLLNNSDLCSRFGENGIKYTALLTPENNIKRLELVNDYLLKKQ
ncbi:hypothetical protein BZG01_03265 [Labilibaculum manganireducens]|uniref:Glycosyl transferase family 1 domain-containing protein n=1 Tax=Labilibaculum manganireducens TaxID=1940525 RepID=A0A2N3IEK9_9BACT|nr:glycosyltransferase family 4 protein [Labilibaculum manganireducens]PKQ68750.1 hypothetical protein BZG01_03265 [Labilibaculum manganireducens]